MEGRRETGRRPDSREKRRNQRREARRGHKRSKEHIPPPLHIIHTAKFAQSQDPALAAAKLDTKNFVPSTPITPTNSFAGTNVANWPHAHHVFIAEHIVDGHGWYLFIM